MTGSLDLTVLITTADRPTLLPFAIRSALASAARAEPFVRTRVMVVDNSPSASAKSAAVPLGVTYVQNPERDDRRNPSSARAWAMSQIETDLVAIFDDDDQMLVGHIAAMASKIRAGADVCSSGYWLARPDPYDPSVLVPYKRQLLRLPRLGDLLAGVQPVNDQAMIRTDVARSVRWEPARENTMMYHVWMQLVLAERRFDTTGIATFLYRRHPTSLSQTLDARDDTLRSELIAEFGQRAIDRYGHLPAPSLDVRARALATRLRRWASHV